MVISKISVDDKQSINSFVNNYNDKAAEENWGLVNGISFQYMDSFPKNCAKIILICQPNSHVFQTRKIQLEENVEVKVGRSIARSKAAEDNAIFDCKVLSRNHAILWYSEGKFFLKDTKSSNGTFINDRRIGQSEAEELHFGDIVKFGVDVIENTRKEVHGCIIAFVKLYLPDGREYVSENKADHIDVINSITFEEFNKLHYYLQETLQREKLLEIKLKDIQNILDTSKKNAANCWHAMIDEDKLLNKIDVLENKLQFYQKNIAQDKLKDEVLKLQEEKFTYQSLAKEALQKVYSDKIESLKKLSSIEADLCNSQEECSILRKQFSSSEKLVEDLNNRLHLIEAKYLKCQGQINESKKLENDFPEKNEAVKSDICNLNQESLTELNESVGSFSPKLENTSENIKTWFENSDIKSSSESSDIIKAICEDNDSYHSDKSVKETDILNENECTKEYTKENLNDDEKNENSLNLQKDLETFIESSTEMIKWFYNVTSSKHIQCSRNKIIFESNIDRIRDILQKISLLEMNIQQYTFKEKMLKTSYEKELNADTGFQQDLRNLSDTTGHLNQTIEKSSTEKPLKRLVDEEIEEDVQSNQNFKLHYEEELIIWKDKYESLTSKNRQLETKMDEIKNISSYLHFLSITAAGVAFFSVVCYFIIFKL